MHVCVCGLTGAKSLKGADRSHISHLQKLAKDASIAALHAFGWLHLIPFVRDLTAALKSKTALPPELTGKSTCIVHLQGSLEKNHDSLLKEFLSFGNYVATFIPQLVKAMGGELNAEAAQATLCEWHKNRSALCKAVEAFDLLNRGCYQELKSSMDELNSEIERSLQGQVHDQATNHLTACTQVFEMVFLCQQLPSEEDFNRLTKNMEQANLMTSVMGEEGKQLRGCLKFIESMVQGFIGVTKAGECIKSQGADYIIEDALIMRALEGITKQLDEARKAEGGIDAYMEGIQKDFMFMMEKVTFTPSIENTSTKQFWELTDKNTQSIISDIGAIVKHMCKSFTKSLNSIDASCPSLEIPKNLLAVVAVQEILDLEADITKVFCLKASKVVSQCASDMGELLDKIKSAAEKLHVSCQDLCGDHGQYTEKFRACLTWMWLAKILTYFYVFFVGVG